MMSKSGDAILFEPISQAKYKVGDLINFNPFDDDNQVTAEIVQIINPHLVRIHWQYDSIKYEGEFSI